MPHHPPYIDGGDFTFHSFIMFIARLSFLAMFIVVKQNVIIFVSQMHMTKMLQVELQRWLLYFHQLGNAFYSHT